MNMKLKVSTLIVLLLILNSCTRKVAIGNNVENLHHHGQYVEPMYQIKRNKLANFGLSMALPATGFALGYTGITSFGITGPIGGVISSVATFWPTLYVSKLIHLKALDKERLIVPKNKEYPLWLDAYNKKNGTKYEFVFKSSNGVYLAEKANIEEFAKEELIRQEVRKQEMIEQNRRNTHMIIDGLGKIGAKIIENNRNSSSSDRCKECNGAGKIHWREKFKNDPSITGSSKEYYDCEPCDGTGKSRN